jgi:hypothetical protein
MGSVNLRSSDGLIDGSAVMQRFKENLTLASGNAECPSHRIFEGFIRLGLDPAFLQKFMNTFDNVCANHAKPFHHIAYETVSLVDRFVAADRILCEVAGLEGFPVINPEYS